jgi:hypothetical protein
MRRNLEIWISNSEFRPFNVQLQIQITDYIRSENAVGAREDGDEHRSIEQLYYYLEPSNTALRNKTIIWNLPQPFAKCCASSSLCWLLNR